MFGKMRMRELEEGASIVLFIYVFPTVTRDQVIAVLEAAKRDMLEYLNISQVINPQSKSLVSTE